jgi:hypothetical protein
VGTASAADVGGTAATSATAAGGDTAAAAATATAGTTVAARTADPGDVAPGVDIAAVTATAARGGEGGTHSAAHNEHGCGGEDDALKVPHRECLLVA